MLYYSTKKVQLLFFGGFFVYTTLLHLPRQHSELKKYIDCKIYGGTKVKAPDQNTKAWVVPSLMLMPILVAYILYDLNKNHNLSGFA